jgi:hypothetical protein
MAGGADHDLALADRLDIGEQCSARQCRGLRRALQPVIECRGLCGERSAQTKQQGESGA